MRRPGGFQHPAQPAPEPARKPTPGTKAHRNRVTTARSDEQTPRPTESTSTRGAVGPLKRSSKPFDASDTTTEPIIHAGVRASVAANTEIPVPGVTSLASANTTEGSSGGTAGARAARSVLRAAQRARKRFERAEVRRFTGRTRRRRTAWILGAGSVVVAFGLIIGAAYSPLMALRTIEVVGTSRIPATDVSAALAGQIGTPLPLIETDLVKSELSQFTLIQSYVTESRPPGTLVVRIIERVPVGVLAGPTGFDLVDAAGVVIETTPVRTAGYPLIDAPNGIDSAGFTAAAAVLTVLPDSIRTQLDAVTAATTDDVTLSLLGGERVVWGSAEKSEYKAVVLAALLIGHPAGTVNEYDVSSPDSAVLR